MRNRKPEWFCGDAKEWELLSRILKAEIDNEENESLKRRNGILAILKRAGVAALIGVPVGSIGFAFMGAAGSSGAESVLFGTLGFVSGMLGGPILLGGSVFVGGIAFAAALSAKKAIGERLGEKLKRDAARSLGGVRLAELSKNAEAASNLFAERGLDEDTVNSARNIFAVSCMLENLAEKSRLDGSKTELAERTATEELRRLNPSMFGERTELDATESSIKELGERGADGLAALILARVALRDEEEESQTKRELSRVIEKDLPNLMKAWSKVPPTARSDVDHLLGCSPEESLRRGFAAALKRVSEIRGEQARKAALATEAEARVLESRVSSPKG